MISMNSAALMNPVALSTHLYIHAIFHNVTSFRTALCLCIGLYLFASLTIIYPLFIHASIHITTHPFLFTLYTHPCISTHISVGAAVSYFELIPGVPVVEFVWWKFPITLREVGRQNRTDAGEEQLEPHEAASHHIHLSHIHRSPAQHTHTVRHTCADHSQC